MNEARCETLLANWCRWMHHAHDHRLGYPSKASGGIEVYTSNMDFDIACEHMDNELAAATDAVVDGLQPPEYRTAIYAQLLGGPWPRPMIALGMYFRVAVQHVARGLERKGIE